MILNIEQLKKISKKKITPYIMPGITPIDHIMKSVIETTGITDQQLRGSSRKREIVKARQAFIYFAKQHGYTNHTISRWLNRLPCSIQHHAARTREYVAQRDHEFCSLLNQIRN